jgi:hypothetical protein
MVWMKSKIGGTTPVTMKHKKTRVSLAPCPVILLAWEMAVQPFSFISFAM